MPSKAEGGVPGILGKDIALTPADGNGSNWTPIYEYTGTFDGRNHTISGLTVKNVYCAAFFEVLKGNVKDMKLSDVNVEGIEYAGGIAGEMYGATISGCEVDGAITGGSYAGGIAGRASGMDIDTCTNYATITGDSRVGGIAGISENSSSIKGCTNYGDVSGRSQIGGIIGLNASSEPIESCTNNGEIKGTGDSVGGIVGDTPNDPGTRIIECTNRASVSGKDKVGGICGRLTNEASIVGCRNEGEETINGSSNVGGIAGYISSSEIMYCYNKMKVTASSENAGGIAGGSAPRLKSSIEGCYNTADITATKSSGGIIGDADPSDSFEACYSTGSAYYGIGGPEDGWGEGPTFSACYWSGQNGGGGGITISGIRQVSSWTEAIMENLNNAITSPAQYLYEETDLQSNEPYKLVKQEATS